MKKVGKAYYRFFPALVMVLFFYGLGSAQVATNIQRTLSASGSGSVQVIPDVVLISLGVESRAADAATALTTNSETTERLIEVIKQQGILAEDIQTSMLSLYPIFQEQFTAETPAISAYAVSNILSLRLRDLDQLGALLNTLVLAGGNIIQGLSFELSNPSARLDEARERALVDATEKAQKLASLLGEQLGAVLTVSEAASPGLAYAMQSFERSVPIEAGTQALRVEVHVTWLLE